jgi:hypothetical protein
VTFKRKLGSGILATAAALLFSACAGVPDAPLEPVDLGTYTVVEFRLPTTDHSASPYGQRLVGTHFTFGPYKVEFPEAYGQSACVHDGYRLTDRESNFIPPFDLGAGNTYTLTELDVSDRNLTEIWSSCVNGAFMTTDRTKMYLPAQGVLLILEKQ